MSRCRDVAIAQAACGQTGDFGFAGGKRPRGGGAGVALGQIGDHALQGAIVDPYGFAGDQADFVGEAGGRFGADVGIDADVPLFGQHRNPRGHRSPGFGRCWLAWADAFQYVAQILMFLPQGCGHGMDARGHGVRVALDLPFHQPQLQRQPGQELQYAVVKIMGDAHALLACCGIAPGFRRRRIAQRRRQLHR